MKIAILAAFALWVAPLSSSAHDGAPPVLSAYKALEDADRARRKGEHVGVDFGGAAGAAVLAAADGVVRSLFGNVPWCRNGIRLWHDAFDRFTHYCNLADVTVRKFDKVNRGQRMAALASRRDAPNAAPMLHFELSDYARLRADGNLAGTYDPMPLMAGCFDSTTAYPTDRLVLTYPIACGRITK